MRTFMNRFGSLKNKLLNLKRPAVRTGRRRTAISTLFLIFRRKIMAGVSRGGMKG